MTSIIFGEFYTEDRKPATLRFCAGATGNREASSGCVRRRLLLMSDAGKQLAEREHYRLRRDAQARAVNVASPVDPLDDAVLRRRLA